MPLIVRLALVFASLAIAGTFLTQKRHACTRFADGATFGLTGTLESRPSESVRTVQLRVSASAACRGLRVRLPDDGLDLSVGDRVAVRGSWLVQRVSVDGNPINDGVLLAQSVSLIPSAGGFSLLRVRGGVQRRLHELFPIAYPLAEALLIAQRESLSPAVRASFAASGLTHLLAISGTHVALVAGSLLLMAQLLRLSRVWASIFSLAGSTAYVLFLGAPFAAVRALIQMVLLLLSRTLQRPAHPMGLLATAAMVVIALNPAAPLDVGFQLSFAGICGIILWRRPLIERMPASVPRPVRDATATTCAATLITTPIAAFHFGIVSLIALIANLLAGPVVSVAVPTAATALAVSYVSMPAARFLAGGAELALLWLFHIAQTCAALPYGHFNAAPRDVVVASIAALLAFSSLRGSYRSTAVGRWATCLLAAAVPLTLGPVLRFDDSLQIHMIDVGQGDALAIRSPRGRWLLVDAGPRSETYDAGQRAVVPFLLDHQADRVEVAILSHPHLDHFGGLRAVLARLPVGAIADPGMPVASPPYDSLLAAAQSRGTSWLVLRAGNSLQMDGMRLDFLSPDSISLDPGADANEYSASFRLRYGRFSALFLGDLYVAEEARLVRRERSALDVDLLKVAHHGSASSSSDSLLEAVTPAVALVSVGRRNHYGHPDPRTMARLHALGTQVFRSDKDGSVSVFVDRGGRMRVRTAQ